MSRRLKNAIITLAAAVVILVLLWIWRLGTPVNQLPGGREAAAPATVPSTAGDQMTPPELPATEAVSEPAATATNPPPANAADVYRRAFTMVEALTDAEKRALYEWDREVDPADAAELCAKLKPISDLAHEAAGSTNSDWGLKQATFDTPLPHLNQARSLARAVVWHAAHCRSGDAGGIAADVEATLRLGQNVSPLIIGHLVNTAIEDMTINYVVANSGAWPGPVQARLQKLFGDSRYEESVSRSLESEAALADQSAETFTAREAGAGGTPPVPSAQLVAATRQVAELEREYARIWNAPETEQQAWLDKLHAAQQANPALANVWQGIDAAMDKARAMVVKRTLVAAGLSLLQNQTDALANHPDPATGQAFSYRATDNGFELQSAYPQQGRPIVLTFPSR